MTRRRSVVSFNLSPSLGDAQSTDGEGDSEDEEHFYLPTHVRSIEETFDAWQQSFKRPESHASMFSSGASSPYPNTPQIREEEEHDLDTQSTSSDYSAQESDTTVSNHARPASRLSYMSDISNSEKTLSAEVRSRVSTASSVSFPQETASQTGSTHEELNVEYEDKSVKSFGADEMTRSLSSAVSFISEHGQITQSSTPAGNFGDEPVQSEDDSSITSKETKTVLDTEPIAKNVNKEESVLIVRIETEQNLNLSGLEKEMDKNESVLVKDKIASRKETTENASITGTESEQDVSAPRIELSGELLSHVDEKRVEDNYEVRTEASDERLKIPSIVKTVCTDDVEGHGSSVDSYSEAHSRNEGNSESFPAEVDSEDMPETREDFFNLEEKLPPLDVENSTVDEETGGRDEGESLKDEEKPGGLDEADCLHCQSIPKRKVAIPVESTVGIVGSEDPAESKFLGPDFETTKAAFSDHHSEQKSTENESVVDEQTSVELDGNSELEPQQSTSVVSESGQENNSAEPQVLQKEPEPQDYQEDAESEIQDSQDESEEKNQDDDDEGGYTTEASATTLQGIRGVFGRRLTRCSTAATSVGFDCEDESSLSEDGFDAEERPYDLATKQACDAFKEFLLETSGENLLQFWLEVETGRLLDDENEKNRCVYCTCALRTVPTLATAHTFCAFRYGLEKSGFYRRCLLKGRYFCAVYNYAGKADLCKGNPK